MTDVVFRTPAGDRSGCLAIPDGEGPRGRRDRILPRRRIRAARAAKYPFAATSANYAEVPDDAAPLLAGVCPIIASCGGRDRTTRGVPERLQHALAAAEVEHDVATYPLAGHSFLSTRRYPRVLGVLTKLMGMNAGPHEPSADQALGSRAGRRIATRIAGPRMLQGAPCPRFVSAAAEQGAPCISAQSCNEPPPATCCGRASQCRVVAPPADRWLTMWLSRPTTHHGHGHGSLICESSSAHHTPKRSRA